jgi:DNA-binding response OmpR family regulator
MEPDRTPSLEIQIGSLFMNPTLLIAEGDVELCGVYRGFFACQGFDVETVSDGLDCVEKLRCVTPAVLVLARELRWGGGDGVLAWLRDEGVRSGVAVVLTTTAGCPPLLAAFTEPPVVDHLCKPFALTALLESICSAVARSGAKRKEEKRTTSPFEPRRYPRRSRPCPPRRTSTPRTRWLRQITGGPPLEWTSWEIDKLAVQLAAGL